VVDTVKFFLTSFSITLQNVIVVFRAVCAHVRDPKITEMLGSSAFGRGLG